MIGEDQYEAQRKRFFEIQQNNREGYEAILFMDSATGLLKRKLFIQKMPVVKLASKEEVEAHEATIAANDEAAKPKRAYGKRK